MEYNHKSDFRISCIKKLKKSSRLSKYYKSKIIVKNLRKTIEINSNRNILFYIPMDIEVDIEPLIKEYRKHKNKNIYVPFIQGNSFKIVKYRLPLKKKNFNVKEPNNSFLKPRKIDIAIIPVIGVDAQLKRIGFGKGMYDRFFWNLGYKPVMVFTQLILCKSSKTLSNNYDIQADYIIST